MKMNKEKLDAFCEMMTKELNKIDCRASFGTDSEYCRTDIVVEHRNCIGTQYYAVNWKEVYSLTEAAVPILVDIKTRLNSTVDNRMYEHHKNENEMLKNIYYGLSLTIKDVIFNPPATIVLWMDGTKTVVKDQGEVFYDPEKGMAMAVAKKAFGNQGNYYNQFAKYLDIYEKKQEDESTQLYPTSVLQDAVEKLKERLWKANYNSKCNYDSLPNEKQSKIDTKIVFEDRINALVALSNLKDIFDRYGVVSVGDLYDEAAIKCDYMHSRFGWKDHDAIHNAKIVTVKGGYMIDLPEPVEFE